MKFGIQLNHEYEKGDDLQQRIEELIAQTELARDCGYSQINGLHHYLSSLTTLQPLPLLSRLVPHSGDMKLGIGVYLTYESPVQLAENFATLDQLSGGRLVLGLGAGYRANEFAAFGIDRPSRWSRMVETVELLDKLWSGEEVHHRGRHFTIEGEILSIVPHQEMPPIWIGANGEKTVRAAGTFADAWIAPPNVKFSWVKGHLEYFKESLLARGLDLDGLEYPIIRELYIADTDEQAEAEADEFIRNEYADYSEYGDEVEYWRTMYHELREKAFIFGSPDTVAAKIENLAEAGFNHFIWRVCWKGMPNEMALNTIRRFSEEVMPRFQDVRGEPGLATYH